MITKSVKLGLGLIMLCVLAQGFPAYAQSWSNGYAFRRAVTIDHTKVPNTDQSNFPILISGTYAYLATVVNGGGVSNGNGYDIIFTSDAAGTTVLPFEQESYSAATGAVIYWVRIPTLSHTTDTVIYLFYGNGSIATDQSNKATVWDGNYAGVWHLDQDPTGSAPQLPDSTSNANDGSAQGTWGTSQRISGKIGGGLSFLSASGDYLSTANSFSSGSSPQSETLQIWFKSTSSSGTKLIGYEDTQVGMISSGYDRQVWLGADGKLYGGFYPCTYPGQASSSTYNDGNWHQVVLTLDTSAQQAKLYADGALVGNAASCSGVNSYSGYFRIGSYKLAWWSAAADGYFNGSLDEARVSLVARSADWIATEFNNQNNPAAFYSVGSADVNGSPGGSAPFIAGLWPANGPITTPVTIMGANFGTGQGTSTVTFNGTAASAAAWNDSAILVPAPLTATSGDVVVTVFGVSSNHSSFTLTTAPGITDISPTSGIVGNRVVITGVNFGSTQGSSTVTLNSASCSVVAWNDTAITVAVPSGGTSGPFTVTVGGQSANSPVFTVTPLPVGWADQDIGAVGQSGSSTYTNGAYTVSGAGQGSSTTDAFRFVYQTLSGDGTIIARVVSLQATGSGYLYPAAGVMVRETLDANSKYADTVYQQYYQSVNFWYRTTTGGSAANAGATVPSLPYWVKLVRSGNTFTGFMAMDGVNWIQVGTSQTINMAQNVYVGLAVTNGNTTGLATATFDSVSVNSPANPGPWITNVSATTGAVGSQVTIYGTGFGATQGGSQVTLNNAVVTINSWTSTSIVVTIPTGATSGPLLVSVAPGMNDSNPVNFTITSHPLPASWLNQDVGVVGQSGTATYNSGAFTINTTGVGIWGTSDGMHFVYQPLTGDGSIIARVANIQGGYYPVAGVMIRETLTPGAAEAFVHFTPNQAFLWYRASTGASTSSQSASLGASAFPYWVRLTRSGDTFTGAVSLDGTYWIQIGASQTIPMNQTVYIGLAACSCSTSYPVTVTYDNVSVNSSTSPAPAITAVSATTGSVGSQIQIIGIGFGASQGNSSVNLNGVPVTVNSWSSTSILITIPSGASSGYLVVSVAPSMNNSNPVMFTVEALPLAATWLDQDVAQPGQLGLAGSATFSNGVYTVTAAGQGISNNADGMHFVYQPLSGDGTILARVSSVQGTYYQAGVMVRETLNPGSANAFVYFYPSQSHLSYRSSTGGSTTYQNGSAPAGLSYSPYWVKLTRSGNTFTGYISANGRDWTQIGASQSVTMAQNVYIGLAVTNTSLSSLATVTFDSVSISSELLAPPAITGVSATTGSVGSQVKVYGTGFGTAQGGSLVVLNGTSVTVNSWSSGEVDATIPAGATSGLLEVLLAPSMNSSNPVAFGVTSLPLPTGWLDIDVGPTIMTGSATYSSGTFTINGAGPSLSGTTDGFHFVYQPLNGDGVIVARITGAPGSYGGAGLMIRETMDPGAITVSNSYCNCNGYFLMYERTTPGANISSQYGNPASFPYWMKLARTGSSFSGYVSPDGVNWTQIATSQTVNMAQNAYIGFAVSSANTWSLGTGTFDNPTYTPGTMPTISSISPNSGGFGASVTITGSNFGSSQGTSTLNFNGLAATSISSWGDTQIIANVPSSATSGPVTVVVNSVQSNTNFAFTVINPVLTSLAPPVGQAGSTVTVTGTGFGGVQGTSQVLFNGTTGTVLSWGDTSVTAMVPASATSGPITVVEGGVTSNGLQFSIESLSMTGISPAAGSVGSTVTISGTGFGAQQSNSTVDFHGSTAAVQNWSDTEIIATVPSGATTGSVNVTVGSVTWYGPLYTITTTIQSTDSQSHQSSYTSAMIGGLWQTLVGQGSGCSTCTQRGSVSYAYDASGNVLSRTDENGNTTSYTYDANGNVATTTVPITPGISATTTYTYNSFGEVLTATDPMGFVTTNTYDAKGNLLSVATPAPGNGASASVTQFAYNSLGELTTITDPLGHATALTYTSTGLIHTITDAQSNVTTYGYDSRGNRTSVTDANNQQTTFAYDGMNRLTQITYPDTTNTHFGYDSRGRRTSVTDQNGRATSYAYDDADRLVSVTDAASNVTAYGYDTESNLTSITDANNRTTYFAYDAFGRVTQTTFPSGYVETYGYDNIGNLTSKTDRKNQLITYTYDQLNRLVQKSYPDTTTVNYTYDNDSRLTQVTDPTGTYQFTFDNMGRLTGTSTQYAFLTSRTFTTSYGHDAASNRTSFTDPESGSASYAYDTLNRLQTLTPPAAFGSGSFGFGYDALSRRTSLTRPNTVNTSYSYDNLSRLLSVTHVKGGVTLDGAAYTLDNAGNRTAKSDLYAAVTTNYGYDYIYELLSATQNGTTTESYTYDAVGNRLTSLAGSWSNNTSNELTASPSASYTYDYNGNAQTMVNSSGTSTYAWDYENRLVTVSLPGSGGTVYFKYDPFGRHIYKSSSSGTSIYAYDGDNVVEETNGTGGAVARYSQGLNIDEPLAMLRSSTTSYFQADGLGSVTSLSNASGSLANAYTYDSFGDLVASTGTILNSFRYTGREWDSETSLYYYRARYYDPSTGRFWSEDPTGFNADPNFYRYAANAPLTWRDPTGKGLDWGLLLKSYSKAKSKGDWINCFVSLGFCGNDLKGVSQGLQGMTSEQELNTAIAIQESQNPNNSGATASNNNLSQGLCQSTNCVNAIEQCINKVPLAGPISAPPWWKQIIKYFSGPGFGSSNKGNK